MGREEWELGELWWLSGVFSVAFALRWAVGLGPYSGMESGPMFGDYEAQRHWMELTLHLPPSQWYRNGSDNDLFYWGLDYPPLTAYHSRLMGRVAHGMSPRWVALHSSRGFESPAHKRFMRWSVLAIDLALYFPAAAVWVSSFQGRRLAASAKAGLLSLHLLYPGFLLIDHGHFQYNCASLGLCLWAVVAALSGWDLLASAFFVAALNYKQMELYHALPFFAALLGSCLRRGSWLLRLSRLGAVALVTLSSFVLLWLPFLSSGDSALAVLHRLFPFARGIYEDKVANLWCVASVLVKWKSLFEQAQMVRLTLALTSVTLLPGLVCGLANGSGRSFRLHLFTSALSFFLFSFQVHEKSILLAALPALLLLHEEPEVILGFLATSATSLFPLAVKDGTVQAFFATQMIFWALSEAWLSTQRREAKRRRGAKDGGFAWLSLGRRLSTGSGLGLCLVSLALPPPASLPDLWALLNSAFCAGHFLLAWAYFNWRHLCLAFPSAFPASKSKLA